MHVSPQSYSRLLFESTTDRRSARRHIFPCTVIRLFVMESCHRSVIHGVRIASVSHLWIHSTPSAVGKIMNFFFFKEKKNSQLCANQLALCESDNKRRTSPVNVFECNIGRRARGTIKAALSSICIALKVSHAAKMEP